MNIYVGNLATDVTQDELKAAFEEFGEIKSATIISDKFSGESRGFGFVEMPNKSEAISAISGLNGAELKGQNMKVSEARPRNNSTSSNRGFSSNRGGGRGRF
jgi:RNA recognition motif-containing protein